MLLIFSAKYVTSLLGIMLNKRMLEKLPPDTKHMVFEIVKDSSNNSNFFSYGSHETLYAFAPSYAASYKKAGADCTFHVGKGMHHCYALQYFIPGCKPAFDEIMGLINDHKSFIPHKGV